MIDKDPVGLGVFLFDGTARTCRLWLLFFRHFIFFSVLLVCFPLVLLLFYLNISLQLDLKPTKFIVRTPLWAPPACIGVVTLRLFCGYVFPATLWRGTI